MSIDTTVTLLRRMWAHVAWADDLLWSALSVPREGDATAWREYSHIIGAEEVWLARLERRATRIPVWPDISREQLASVRAEVVDGYARYLESLTPETLGTPVRYVNTAGREYSNTIGDIIAHAALHGQYHRGKINLLLRQNGADPVPVDYIAWLRGAPAAVTRI